MTDQFRCGSDERLVAYLYDDCDGAERAAIAAHVATCAECAQEMETLSDTRQLLAAWTPPEVNADWRLSGEDAFAGADGPSPRERWPLPPAAAWWRQPLPAWAQAAAAVVIFAAGLAVGGARSAPAPAPAPVASVMPDWGLAIAAMESRLEAMEQTARAFDAVVAADAARIDPLPEVMRQVRSEIAASEARMRGEVAIGLVQLKREENHLQQSLSEDVDKLNTQVQYVTQLVARE